MLLKSNNEININPSFFNIVKLTEISPFQAKELIIKANTANEKFIKKRFC